MLVVAGGAALSDRDDAGVETGRRAAVSGEAGCYAHARKGIGITRIAEAAHGCGGTAWRR